MRFKRCEEGFRMSYVASRSASPEPTYDGLKVGDTVKLPALTWGRDWASEIFGDGFAEEQVSCVIIALSGTVKKRCLKVRFEDGTVEEHPLARFHAIPENFHRTGTFDSKRRRKAKLNADQGEASITSTTTASTSATNALPVQSPAVDLATRLHKEIKSRFVWSNFSKSQSTCYRSSAGIANFPARFKDSRKKASPYSLFIECCPYDYLCDEIVPRTNAAARAVNPNWQDVTDGEMLRWLGYWVAMSLVSFPDRHSYWGTSDIGPFPAPQLGRHGMSKHRFDQILEHIVYSCEIESDPHSPIRGCLDAWNANMQDIFEPSSTVCLDESMSMWSTKSTCPGWQYVDRKPTSTGMEYHTISCAQSKILFHLELVEVQQQQAHKEYCDQYKAMCSLCLRMTKSLFGSERVLVADSAFSSAAATIALRDHGIHSIMAVKKRAYYPADIPGEQLKAFIESQPLYDSAYTTTKMNSHSVTLAALRDYGSPVLLLTTCGASHPSPVCVERYDDNGNKFSFQRPQLFQDYYSARTAVDDHNNLRQGSYSLEYAWQTKHWRHRAFAYILSTTLTNSYLASHVINPKNERSHFDFLKTLSMELISNPLLSEHEEDQVDGMTTRSHQRQHELLRIPNYSSFQTGKWVDTLKTQYPTRHCEQCGQRTRHYCKCSPVTSVCRSCFSDHISQAMHGSN
jgi:hypothetical protein